MVEIFAVGGGEYIVNVLNAVAAWTGEGGYKSLIQVVMVMAFAMSCLIIAFNSDWRAWINWFLQATLMYMCLMVPRVDVKVTDRINSSLAPAAVANVPLGLGLMASFTSQVGDYLVRSSEVVFGLPGDLNYSQNGMIYGSRLFEATQAVQINDPEFASNLDEHMRQCVFYDVLLGRKSMGKLASSDNLWADLGPGSQSRAQKFLTRNPDDTVSSEILTCREAYDAMTARWEASDGVLDGVVGRLSRSLYPKLADSVAKAKLASDVPTAYAYMTGVSSSASAILKQNLLINAMAQAMHTMPGSVGNSAVDVYAQTRADIQTRNTYSAISHAAMKWVPLLNIVLTTLFYALFPVLFPLFLMPRTGVPALKGYVTGFFYLAAWGPIFVILHMIMMFKAAAEMASQAGGVGVTLASSVGIAGVNDDVGLLAGYLIASVPFLAAGVARGAMAVSSHATSFLAPSQNAAESAAAEATTGNLSVGNSSFDNQTINTRQQGMWNTAPNYMTGASAFAVRQDNGTVTTEFAGGTVVDTSGAMSRLAASPQLTSEYQASLSKSAESYKARASTLANTASSMFSTSHTQAEDFRHQLSSGTTLEGSYGFGDRQQMQNTWAMVNSAGDALAAKIGVSQSVGRSMAQEYFDSGQISSNLGLSVPALGGSTSPRPDKPGASAGGSLGMSYGRSDRSTESGSLSSAADISKAKDFLDNVSRTQNWSEARDSFWQAASRSSNGELSSKAQSISSSLTRAASLSREARQSYDNGQRLSESAQAVERDGISLSSNLSQEFVDYVLKEQATTPYLHYTWNPTRGNPNTPQEQSEMSIFMDRFLSDRIERIKKGFDDQSVSATPAGLEGPSANSQAGVAQLGAKWATDPSSRALPDSGAPTEALVEGGRAYQQSILEYGKDRVEPRLRSRVQAMGKASGSLVSGRPQETFDKVSPVKLDGPFKDSN